MKSISVFFISIVMLQSAYPSDKINDNLVNYAFKQCDAQGSLLQACDKALNASIDNAKDKEDVIAKQQKLLQQYEKDSLKAAEEKEHFYNSRTFWWILGGVTGAALYKNLRK